MDEETRPSELRVGEKVRELREAKGLSLQDMANRTGYTSALLSQVENHLISPPLGALIKIAKALETYRGVDRRLSWKGTGHGVTVVDDYAHHPTECAATLSGAKAGWRRRVVCVFQPHLFTRTRDFYEEFGKAFLLSDVLVVTDIYPAREEPIQGVTGGLIANAAKQFGHKEVHYVADKTKIPSYLRSITKEGDIVITMGAGDIWKFGEQFLKELRSA